MRECGVCGRVRRIEIRARDGRPDICTSCALRRPGTCGVCGRVARIARKATGESPAVGICCYRPPLAVCTDCRRDKPCYHARGPAPVCPSCTALRRAPVCVDCGKRRAAHRRVEGGVIGSDPRRADRDPSGSGRAMGSSRRQHLRRLCRDPAHRVRRAGRRGAARAGLLAAIETRRAVTL
jgi:hypothetical protein